jgi:hypothetical protein
MDYRNILAIGFVLLCGAVFVTSLKSANAFPQGPSVSYGGNPVLSVGGSLSSTSVTLFSAPSDQKIVVSDLLLTMNHYNCSSTINLVSSSGDTLATVDLHSFHENHQHYSRTNSQPTSIQHSFSSGLPLSPGESLEIIESGGCDVAYTISGYYAHL